MADTWKRAFNKVAVTNQFENEENRRNTAPIGTGLTQNYPPRLHKQSSFGRLATQLKQKHGSTRTMVYFIAAFLLLFLLMYIIWFNVYPESFGLKPDSSASSKTVDGIYYFSTVTSTVGFGDICPKTKTSKMVTSMYQMFLFALSLGALWKFTDGKLKDIVSKTVNKVAHRTSVNTPSNDN